MAATQEKSKKEQEPAQADESFDQPEINVTPELRQAVIERVIATLKDRSLGIMVDLQNELNDLGDEAGALDELALERWIRDDAGDLHRTANRMNDLAETLMEKLHEWKERKKAGTD